MKRFLLAACLLAPLSIPAGLGLGTTASLAMPAEAQNPDNAASARIGRAVARQYCSGCHAISRQGASPNPKAPRFPLIAERYRNGNPAPDLIDGTVVRHPGMPEFRLQVSETDGLVAYLRRVSRKWRPGMTPGAAR